MPLELGKKTSRSPLMETENVVVSTNLMIQVTNKPGLPIARRVASMNDHFTMSKALEMSSLIAEREDISGLCFCSLTESYK